MAIEVKLPELGDGIDSADVLEVLVREGDEIQKDQGIVEVETDKATVQVPSSHAGVVSKIHIRSGDKIKIGASLVTLETKSTENAAPAAPAQPTQQAAPAEAAPQETSPPAAPANDQPAQAEAPPAAPAPAPAPQATPAPAPVQPAAASQPAPSALATDGDGDGVIAAGPAVRRFAREVGVDLRRVRGTGPGGRITREDVLEVVRQASQVAMGTARPVGTESDAWGPIRVERMSKIRQTIAAKMHESWTSVPRVTNFDDADVTELERIRQSSKNDYASKGIKLTSLPFVLKAVAMALKNHPLINATIDVENEQIIYKDYVNIGIAVDSDRGLVVPVLRNADAKSIPDLARGAAELAEKVRTNNYTIEDLRGGTFTVSNLGAIGGTYSTPIVNVPEVAILLVGRSRKMPVVIDDQITVRLMMPLSLAYDHRLVDGASAARFLNEVISYLEMPSRLLLAP